MTEQLAPHSIPRWDEEEVDLLDRECGFARVCLAWADGLLTEEQAASAMKMTVEQARAERKVQAEMGAMGWRRL